MENLESKNITLSKNKTKPSAYQRIDKIYGYLWKNGWAHAFGRENTFNLIFKLYADGSTFSELEDAAKLSCNEKDFIWKATVLKEKRSNE